MSCNLQSPVTTRHRQIRKRMMKDKGFGDPIDENDLLDMIRCTIDESRFYEKFCIESPMKLLVDVKNPNQLVLLHQTLLIFFVARVRVVAVDVNTFEVVIE